MADIVKRTDKPRDKPYRVRVRRTGHKPIEKYFRTRESAKVWARQQEDSIERFGVPAVSDKLKELLGQKEDKDKGIKDGILWRYIKEVSPDKGSSDSELSVLKRFADDPICKLSLAVLSVQREHAYEYRDKRLKAVWVPKGAKKGRPITPRTVRREINSISHVFTIARDEWGYRGLVNPFEGMEVKGSTFKRTRVLRPGEYQKLLQACRTCRGVNKFYSMVVISFARFTGMRLQEIINLRWQDINLKDRTITIVKSKTDKQQDVPGRVIPMPFVIECAIDDLVKATVARAKGEPVTEQRIFPITVSAFKQLWHDLVIRAGIPSKEEDAKNGVPEQQQGLEFLDLRREAGSGFNAADLNSDQHDLMLGHNDSSNKIRGIYIAPSPAVIKAICDKIDRHTVGMTREEIKDQYGDKMSIQDIIAQSTNIVQFPGKLQ